MSSMVNVNAEKDSVDVDAINVKLTSSEIQGNDACHAIATTRAVQVTNATLKREDVTASKASEAKNATLAIVATLVKHRIANRAESVSIIGTSFSMN